jgi:hypothetical protein
MRRLTAIVGFSALCLGLNALAADNSIDFSGKWILNIEKSDPTPRKTVIGRAAADGRGGTRADGSISRVGGRFGSGMPSGRVDGGMAGGRAGGGMAGGRAGDGNVNPGIGMDGGTFDGESLIARDVPLVITQTETEIKILISLKINGRNVPNVENYRLDGEKHEETVSFGLNGEGKQITKAKLDKNKLAIEITAYNPQGAKFLKNKEFSLSKDGKTMTLKVAVQSPLFLSSEQRVYDKQ